MLDWQASEAHAVDLLAQRDYAHSRTRDRKVERIHLETCSGAYFVRPSDNEILRSTEIGAPTVATTLHKRARTRARFKPCSHGAATRVALLCSASIALPKHSLCPAGALRDGDFERASSLLAHR